MQPHPGGPFDRACFDVGFTEDGLVAEPLEDASVKQGRHIKNAYLAVCEGQAQPVSRQGLLVNDAGHHLLGTAYDIVGFEYRGGAHYGSIHSSSSLLVTRSQLA